MKRWYVTFGCKDKSGNNGFGYKLISNSKRTLMYEDLEEIREIIMGDFPELENVVILNWKRIEMKP